MLHTENNEYRLFYEKGYSKTKNGNSIWVRTEWYVLDISNTKVWVHKGRLTSEKIHELLINYNLKIKLN